MAVEYIIRVSYKVSDGPAGLCQLSPWFDSEGSWILESYGIRDEENFLVDSGKWLQNKSRKI
jgi:hypothetical protein